MRISAQYPLVEAASAALAVSSLWLTPDPLQAIPLGLGLCTMLFASFTDLRTQTIPDLLLLLLCTFGLLTTLLSPSPTLWGGLVAGGFFAAQWLISRGRWIGSGDIALGLGLGLMVGGVREGIMLLLAAYILGAIITSVGLVSGRLTRHDSVAFGPFLGLGALVTLWGSPLTLTWLAQRGL
jgi:prepilin signal peptidase PulO-like enzyme (type II secretory pathway)